MKDSEEKFKSVIYKHSSLFVKIVSGAFKEELESTSQFSYRLKPLGHAIITNNFIIDNALKMEDDTATFRMYKIKQANYFVIKDEKENVEIHGKFKKLRNNFLSSNIPTQTVLQFLSNETADYYQYELEFMPERINVIVGYIPNEARTDIKIYVTRPIDEKHLAWILPLPEEGEEGIIDTSKDVPVIPRIPADLQRKQRVRTPSKLKEKNAE